MWIRMSDNKSFEKSMQRLDEIVNLLDNLYKQGQVLCDIKWVEIKK